MVYKKKKKANRKGKTKVQMWQNGNNLLISATVTQGFFMLDCNFLVSFKLFPNKKLQKHFMIALLVSDSSTIAT